MSIFIIRGPEATGRLIRTATPLPSPVLKALVERAIDAGTTIAIRACGSEQERWTRCVWPTTAAAK